MLNDNINISKQELQPEKAVVTFVMPAYNVENYLENAVNSLKKQSFKNWELVIVNDGSTDRTLELALSLAESERRIKVMSMKEPSGSAYQPRKKAILAASADWVSPLDADDLIAPDYLEKLWQKQLSTNADIIYPTMMKGDDIKVEVITPRNETLYNKTLTGREALELTLDGWKINCNGGIIRKNLYEKAFNTFDSSLTYSCADELLTRQLLSITPNVAISDAHYYYTFNPTSITRKKSLKLFDFLKNNRTLIDFTKERYGPESSAYILAQKQNFHGIFDALGILNRYQKRNAGENFSKEEISAIYEDLRKSKEMADTSLIKDETSPRYRFLLKFSFPVIRKTLSLMDSLKDKK